MAIIMDILKVFFIHSSVDGHLDPFPNLAIVSSAMINMVCRYLYWMLTFSPLGIYPGVMGPLSAGDPKL
jgi:hypothetical protein